MEERALDGKRTGQHPTARGRRTGAIDTINGGRAPDSWRALHRSVGPAPAAGAWLQTAKPRKPQTPVPLSARARALPAARSSLPFGGPARVARGQAQAGPDLPSLTAEPGQVGHQAREEKRPPGVIKERIKGSLRVIKGSAPARAARRFSSRSRLRRMAAGSAGGHGAASGRLQGAAPLRVAQGAAACNYSLPDNCTPWDLNATADSVSGKPLRYDGNPVKETPCFSEGKQRDR